MSTACHPVIRIANVLAGCHRAGQRRKRWTTSRMFGPAMADGRKGGAPLGGRAVIGCQEPPGLDTSGADQVQQAARMTPLPSTWAQHRPAAQPWGARAVADIAAVNLGRNIAQLRKARGLSQQQISKVAGIPRATWANLESGGANPTLA